MAEKNIRWLFIDDNTKILESFKDAIEYIFPNIDVISADTLTKGVQAVADTKKPFNIISCDILIDDAVIRDASGKVTRVSSIEFLKHTEAMHPQTHLAIISAIRPEEKLKGVEFLMKGSLSVSEGEFHEFINSVIKNPWKRPIPEKIDLGQFMRPMLHVDPATGRKQLIQIVKSAAARDDKTLLNMMRAGYRPPGKEQAVRNLQLSLKQAHGREGRLLENALERLKRPRIMK